MAGLEAAQADNAYNRVRCNNDLAADSTIVFEDVDGTIILPDPDTAVPPGGTVHVFLTCAVPPQLLGGFWCSPTAGRAPCTTSEDAPSPDGGFSSRAGETAAARRSAQAAFRAEIVQQASPVPSSGTEFQQARLALAGAPTTPPLCPRWPTIASPQSAPANASPSTVHRSRWGHWATSIATPLADRPSSTPAAPRKLQRLGQTPPPPGACGRAVVR